MPGICFYFQVHQPLRVKRYRIFDIGRDHAYFNGDGDDNLNNRAVLAKVSEKCYLKANRIFLNLLNCQPKLKISFSISGILLDQLEKDFPEVLDSFKDLARTGRVEFLAETYYHSLSFLYSKEEFKRQVNQHRLKRKKLFGQWPKTFRNTELIYNNDIAKAVEALGFGAILAEGADHVLGWRSPNFLYRPDRTRRLKLLLKNYRLSDDVAFRFSSRDWSEFPLTAPKFAEWLAAVNGGGEIINLFMDYETLGEHQWEETGIFEFLKALPEEILKNPDNYFVTPSEAARRYRPVAELDIPYFVSWADIERDLSAWLSNSMQKEALEKVFSLEKKILGKRDKRLLEDWRRLQTSDHFYYMCTKWFADGDVHKYFNPYESPYDAFISYMNALKDLELRLEN